MEAASSYRDPHWMECSNLEKTMAEVDKQLDSGSFTPEEIQGKLQSINTRLEAIKAHVLALKSKKGDSRNLEGRVSRLADNLGILKELSNSLIQSSGPTHKAKMPVAQESHVPLKIQDLPHLLQHKVGAKSSGGKEIQKVIVFDQWLDAEYQNKKSPTYMAYQYLASSQKLNKALFVGIRGDGDCGFRAMIASMLLQLTVDPQCSEKFCELVKRLKVIVTENEKAIPGFERLNKECLQRLEQCTGRPKEVMALINDDQFISGMTRVFRFLSNAICSKDFKALPEEIRIQLEYGEGAQECHGVNKFLEAHANLDVAKDQNIKPYLFAGVSQILVLAQKLGVGYWMGIVDEGQPKPQQPNIVTPKDPLLTMTLLCRDTRHFDVIIK